MVGSGGLSTAFTVGLSPTSLMTFPSPSLKFRTAGFPQYGFKASLSDRASPTAHSAACVRPPPRRWTGGDERDAQHEGRWPATRKRLMFTRLYFGTGGSD